MAMKSSLHWCVKDSLHSFDNLAAGIVLSPYSSLALCYPWVSLCAKLRPCHAGLLEVRNTIYLTKSEPALGNFNCAKQTSKGEMAAGAVCWSVNSSTEIEST